MIRNIENINVTIAGALELYRIASEELYQFGSRSKWCLLKLKQLMLSKFVNFGWTVLRRRKSDSDSYLQVLSLENEWKRSLKKRMNFCWHWSHWLNPVHVYDAYICLLLLVWFRFDCVRGDIQLRDYKYSSSGTVRATCLITGNKS